MHKSAFAFLCLISVGVGITGCAEVDKIDDFLTSPKMAQAISVLKSGASAFVCNVADSTRMAQQIETAVSAGQSVQGADGKLYVSSAIVCGSLGGTVTGTGIVQ